MGYPRHGPFTDAKYVLFEPTIHTNGRTSKDITHLGYGVNENLPIEDQEPPTTIDLEDDIQPMATTIAEEDFIPSTSIL